MAKDLPMTAPLPPFPGNGRQAQPRKAAALGGTATVLALAGCGGGGGGTPASGTRDEGSLVGAFVFADVNSNGIHDPAELGQFTGPDGRVTFDIPEGVTVVLEARGYMIDSLTGLSISGVSFKTPPTGAIISPLTTLIAESRVPSSELVQILDLPEVDLLLFNPSSEAVDPATALSVELASRSVLIVLQGLAGAMEGAGLSTAAAFNAASRGAGDTILREAQGVPPSTFDLTSSATLMTIAQDAFTRGGLAGADITRLNATLDALVASMARVNIEIAALTELDSPEAKAHAALGSFLATEARVATEVGNPDILSLSDPASLAAALAQIAAGIAAADTGASGVTDWDNLALTGRAQWDYVIDGRIGNATLSVRDTDYVITPDAGGSTRTTAVDNVGMFEVNDVRLTSEAGILSGLAVPGTGSVVVTALENAPGADLSGIAVTGTKTAQVTGNVTFTGDLGDFRVVLADDVTLTADFSVLTDKEIDHDGTQDGQALIVTIDSEDDADLSTIATDIADRTVRFTDDITFGGVLAGFAATVDAGRTLEIEASSATGQTIGGEGVTSVSAAKVETVYDFRDLTSAGGVTVTFVDGGVLPATTDLGEAALSIIDGQVLQGTAAQLTNATITGAGRVQITGSGVTALDLADMTAASLDITAVNGGAAITILTPPTAPAQTLTATAAQVTGKPIGGAGITEITAASAATPYDFGAITSAGGVSLTFATGGTLAPATNLGTATLSIAAEQTLGATGEQLTGKTVSGLGAVEITGARAATAYDLAAITPTGGLGITFAQGGTLNAATVLGIADMTIAAGQTLVATAAQLAGRAIDGGGSIEMTGASATTEYDFGDIAPTGGALVTFETGGTLAPGTDLGPVSVVIASGQTLTATAEQLTGKSVSGPGAVEVTDALATAQYDFTGITAAGGRTISYVTSTGNNPPTDLDTDTATIKQGETLTVTAAQATGKTITGAGAVEIIDADATQSYDFAGIAPTGGVSITFTRGGVLNPATALGNAALDVASGEELTVTAAQIDGRAVSGPGDLNISGLDTVTDLSGITLTGTIIVEGEALASALNTLWGSSGATVTATAVTLIEGTLAEFAALLGAGGAEITLAPDFDADVTPPVTGASAANVTALNDLMAATTGEVSATVSGTAAVLGALQAGTASTPNLALTVTNAATASQGAAIVAATDATSVDFSAGIADSLSNLASGGLRAAMTSIVGADSDVDVTVSGTIAAASTQNVNDLNALIAATTGDVTATIDGDADVLDNLAASASDDGTSALSITVNDAASIAEATLIAAATDIPAIAFAGGLEDSLANLAASGSANAGLVAILARDSDARVEVSNAITGATAQNVTDLNALLAAVTGEVVATIAGNVAQLSGLSLTANDSGTSTLAITVNDAASMAQLDRIDAATDGTLTYDAIIDTASNLANNSGGYVVDIGVNGLSSITVDQQGASASAANLNTINAQTTAPIRLVNMAEIIMPSSGGTFSINDQEYIFGALDIVGSENADTITVGSGSVGDRINGRGGDDIITGGAGADVLTGGAGADTFVFAPGASTGTGGAASDDITDLEVGDKIDLSAINSGTINFITNATATDLAGAGITFTAGFDVFVGTVGGQGYLFYETTAQGVAATDAGTLEVVGIDISGTLTLWTQASGVITIA